MHKIATMLQNKTTISELTPGDIFAYSPGPGLGDRLVPVVSVEDISGQPLAAGDGVYPEGMHRVRYENSDALGTLFYGHEIVYRAKRS